MKILVTGGKVVKSHRDSMGRFLKSSKLWSLDNFNDGYFCVDNRFRVRMPNHPRAGKNGRVLRSIVAFELYYNIRVPKNREIHHKDGNTLNDSIENLELLTREEHKKLHVQLRGAHVERTCMHCKKTFEIERYRLNYANQTRGKYCSLVCYHNNGYTKKHKQNISEGLKKAYREGRR